MLSNANRFHLLVFATWQFTIFFASQQIFPIFSNYVPQWRCDESEPFGKNCTSYLACRRPVQFENMAFHSAALEYDWVCGSRAYLASLFSQIQFAGVLCGTFLYGTLSDWFGRRPISLLCLASGIGFNALSGVAMNVEMLLITRFFVGLAAGGNSVVVCAFVMELLLPDQRIYLRGVFNWMLLIARFFVGLAAGGNSVVVCAFVMELLLPDQRIYLRGIFNWVSSRAMMFGLQGNARLMLTSICYFFPEWRQSSIACAVAALPAFLIVLFVFPESPTWLHNKHRMEEMRRSERKIARIAGVPYVEVEHPKLEKKKGFLSLIKDAAVVRRIIVLWLMWFTACITSFVNDLNSSFLSGNFFLNQSAAVLVVNVIGTVFIEFTWDACYLCAVEAMPTNMRTSSMGSCSLVARIGALLSPIVSPSLVLQAGTLRRQSVMGLFLFLNRTWPPSAYLMVSTLGMVNLIASYFFLVETKGINLDAVKIHEEDVEEDEQMDMLKKENGSA
uniref:MFS domain-containing protein n=1 Tax=Steinernema glaseri TaxID=37863 RepID=A0A1I7YL87_9BILA